MKLISIIVALIALLCGCAGVNPDGLVKLSSGDVYFLEKPFVYREHYRLGGNVLEYTIAPGEYRAQFEDSAGVYYLGPEPCLRMIYVMVNDDVNSKFVGTGLSYRGGIYVPKNSSLGAKVYYWKTEFARILSPTESIPSGVEREKTAEIPISTMDNAIAGGRVNPLQAGVGVGIASGIITAIDAAELRNVHFHRDQPPGDALRAALSKKNAL